MSEPIYWVQPTTLWDPSSVLGWDEQADVMMPGSGGTYARDDAAETVVGEVNYDMLYDFRRKALGYAYCDSGSPFYLHRVNPLTHPDEIHLSCTSVDVVGKNVMAIPVYPATSPPTYTAQKTALVSDSFPNRTRYSRAVCTLKFRPHPFPFYTDQEMLDYAAVNGYTAAVNGYTAGRLSEYWRSTSLFDSCDPVLQVLAADSQPYFRWIDTPAPTSPPAPPAAPQPTPIPNTTGLDKGQIPLLFSQANLVIVWHGVPEEYLFGNSYLPDQIMKCMGKVNSNGINSGVTDVPWLGTFPRGTLKLEAPRFKKSVQAHIRFTDRRTLSYVYDVFLPFSFTNPTMAALAGGALPSFMGWNGFPWNRTDKFYAVARIDDPTKSVFDYYNFENIFLHHDQSPLAP